MAGTFMLIVMLLGPTGNVEVHIAKQGMTYEDCRLALADLPLDTDVFGESACVPEMMS